MRARDVGNFLTLGAAALLASCAEAELTGLLPTPAASDGPIVTFDLLARPLPEIPFPNDLATRFDPDSPTGRRVNASVAAPTLLEEEVRDEFNRLDGFGTFSAITVGFGAPIDAKAVRDAHLDDDFSNDCVYVIDLSTGLPVAVDMGRGNFPVIVQNNDKYFQNDPREDSSNMLFEVYAEVDANANGVLDPEEDTDTDGTWDRPNTLDNTKPIAALGPPFTPAATPADRGNDVYRDLISFYERESNTLIIRPVVTLKSRTQYAVVLTNRLKGADGRTMRSPFPFVNHVAQTDQLKPLLAHIDAGKIPGLTKDDVAFTWAFTTQSTTQDLEAAREGLYGRGPLGAALGGVSDKLTPVWRVVDGDLKQVPVHPLISDSLAKEINAAKPNPYVAPMKQFRDPLEAVGPLLGAEGPTLTYLLDGYKFVDYFVVGSYRTADLLDDPEKPTAQAVWRVDPVSGTAKVWSAVPGDAAASQQVMDDAEKEYVATAFEKGPGAPETVEARKKMKAASRDRVWFMLAVPKPQYLKNGRPTLTPGDGATPLYTAPFAVNIYGHGYTGNRTEFLGFAGHMAKFGIASVGIDSYGHGLQLGAGDMDLVKAALGPDFGPFADAVIEGRARDLDNDGEENSGGDFWTADTFHTRDVVRQSVLDWAQLIRVFRAFGSYQMGDVNGDGESELAGDFNADGTIDVSGPETMNGAHNPGSDFFVWGQSLGGMLGGVLPSIEPAVKAAAPVAGGAGLSDIGIRSEQGGVIQAVFLQILGPIFWSEPTEGGVQLNVTVQSVNDEKRVRLTSDALPIAEGDRVEIHNLNTDNGEHKMDWAIAGPGGRFRLQVAADGPSFLDGAPVQEEAVNLAACELAKLDAKDLAARKAELKLRYGGDCLELRVFAKKADGTGWETTPKVVGDKPVVMNTFGTDVTFQQRKFAKGSPLIALARGFGFKRGTKQFRRFMALAQTILDPADIANYAPHYFTSEAAGTHTLDVRGNDDVAMMVVGTTGDLNVPVNVAIAQARAAGILDYAYDPAKHADFGTSPNDVLIRTKAVEVIEKLRYFAPLVDPANDTDPDFAQMRALVDCPSKWVCQNETLPDVMHYSKDAQGNFLDGDNRDIRNDCPGAPAEEHDACVAAAHGVPRLKHSLRDVVFRDHPGFDAKGQPATRRSVLVMPMLDKHGRHGFDIADPSNAFDVDLFMVNLIARYFQSRGTDLNYALCMHRDGFTQSRLVTENNPRDPACDFIPDYPADW